MQGQIGNQAVQRLLAQRKGNDGPFELNDETTNQINQHRGGGHVLDSGVQEKLGGAMGYDFSQVKVHTSPEAHDLNQQVGAKAFTTGNDVFFSQGAYSPQTSSGQELIAHELTHVVQQSAGNVGSSGGGMTVNAPNDRYEQEADAVAQTVVSGGAAVQTQAAAVGVQREEVKPEDEEKIQTKADPTIQREEVKSEDEEKVQMKADPTFQREEVKPEDEEKV
jgi:hypothetical protein